MKTLNNYINEALIKKDTKIGHYNKELLEDILSFFSFFYYYDDY